MGLGFLTLEDSIDGVLGAGTDAWSYCVVIHSCVAIPHCVGISSCVSVSVKREAVIAGLASEGLALLLSSAEAGSSAVVWPTPTDRAEAGPRCTTGVVPLKRDHPGSTPRPCGRTFLLV